jgi:DNA ligase D-like protein (predicted ligase)
MQTTYRPMLAKSFPAPFSHKDWLFEVKWDGFRAIAHVKDKVSLKSRNGLELGYNFPEILELKQLTSNVVLDGELVVMKGGLPDFHLMQLRGKATGKETISQYAQKHPATYVVFDILEKDGKSLTDLPLIERKRILKQSVRDGKRVCIIDSIDKVGEDYYKIVAANGLEGVVAKKKDSAYEAGKRSDSWLKIKRVQTCDCVIFGYTKGEGSRASTFGALIVGLYDDGKPVYVCNVSSGLTDKMLDTLTDFFQKTKVSKEKNVTWVKPLIVCEVIYQSLTNDLSLRAPRIKCIHTDKKPSECTIEQIFNLS